MGTEEVEDGSEWRQAKAKNQNGSPSGTVLENPSTSTSNPFAALSIEAAGSKPSPDAEVTVPPVVPPTVTTRKQNHRSNKLARRLETVWAIDPQ